jgi:hypothetical protein
MVLSSNCESHLIVVDDYYKLSKDSDLICIASPITKTLDTGERADALNLVEDKPDGTQLVIQSVGVITKFKILTVLKGDPRISHFILHHFRDNRVAENSNGIIGTDRPAVVNFSPLDGSYLLFLVHESEDLYAPTEGQANPGLRAIRKLSPN